MIPLAIGVPNDKAPTSTCEIDPAIGNRPDPVAGPGAFARATRRAR